MSKRNPATLDQLGYLSRGRSRHRPRDAAHLYGGPYPFIQTGDVKHSDLYLRGFTQTYSEAGLEQSRIWPIGTLCITIAANIAETAILGIEACFPDSIIGFIPDVEKCDARYIKYYFDFEMKSKYRNISMGAAQDNLSQEKLLSYSLNIPGMDEQRRIANTLSKYDNLIENNKRRIELLEESSRLLYKEWFVNLRFPGHEHVEKVDGVPEGWACVTLKDLITLNYGKALKEEDRDAGDFPVFGSSGIVGSHNKSFVNGQGIIVGRKGNVGSVFFSAIPYWPIDTVYYLDTEQATLWNYFTLLKMPFQNSDGAVPGLNREIAV